MRLRISGVLLYSRVTPDNRNVLYFLKLEEEISNLLTIQNEKWEDRLIWLKNHVVYKDIKILHDTLSICIILWFYTPTKIN